MARTAPPSQDYPDYIPIGGAVRLVSCRSFAREFGVHEREVTKLMAKLHVPILQINPEKSAARYINLFTLECVLHGLLRPGGVGFRGEKEPPCMAEGLADYNSPLLREVEFVGRMYGELDRKTLHSRAKQLASYFRVAGDKLCRLRIKQLRDLCLTHRIPVGRTSFSTDAAPDDKPPGVDE